MSQQQQRTAAAFTSPSPHLVGVLLTTATGDGCKVLNGLESQHSQNNEQLAQSLAIHGYFTNNYQALPVQMSRLEQNGYSMALTVGPTMAAEAAHVIETRKAPLPLVCLLPYATTPIGLLPDPKNKLALINGPALNVSEMVSFFTQAKPSMRTAIIPYCEQDSSLEIGWHDLILHPALKALSEAGIQTIPTQVGSIDEVYSCISSDTFADAVLLLEGTSLISYHTQIAQRCEQSNKTLLAGSKHTTQHSAALGYAIDFLEFGRHAYSYITQIEQGVMTFAQASETPIDIPYKKILNVSRAQEQGMTPEEIAEATLLADEVF